MTGIPPWHAATHAYIDKNPSAGAPRKTSNPADTVGAMKFHLFLTWLSGGTGEKAGPHNPNRLPTELPLQVPAKRTPIDDWRIDDW
jgi:hypothetical protein